MGGVQEDWTQEPLSLWTKGTLPALPMDASKAPTFQSLCLKGSYGIPL